MNDDRTGLEMRVATLEIQMGRVVSDMESEKRTRSEASRTLTKDIERIHASVFGAEDTIGIRARVLQNEVSIKKIDVAMQEIFVIVRRLERVAYVSLGGFAIIKIGLDVWLGHK